MHKMPRKTQTTQPLPEIAQTITSPLHETTQELRSLDLDEENVIEYKPRPKKAKAVVSETVDAPIDEPINKVAKPKRQLTEDQKQVLRERLQKATLAKMEKAEMKRMERAAEEHEYKTEVQKRKAIQLAKLKELNQKESRYIADEEKPVAKAVTSKATKAKHVVYQDDSEDDSEEESPPPPPTKKKVAARQRKQAAPEVSSQAQPRSNSPVFRGFV